MKSWLQTIYNKSYLVIVVLLTTVGCSNDGSETSEPLVIEQPNNPPVVSSQPLLSASVESDYRYQIVATDADNDTLSYAVAVLPAWLSFEQSSQTLSGIPQASDIGLHPVVINIADDSIIVEHAFEITVTEAVIADEWQLVWSDEFEGDSLNLANWNIETGDGSQYGIPGWGNNELQWYQEENISVSDGLLKISAIKESSNGYQYTSGRLRSDNKQDFKYGRFEARIKVPAGQGLWSAFWMLPTDSQYGGWASGGEIDIMEAVNPASQGNDQIHGTAHYGMAWPLNKSYGNAYPVEAASGFHIYAVEWEHEKIRWYVDGTHYATMNSDSWWSYFYASQAEGYLSVPEGPFDQNFHLLLNLAVGGNWPGSPDNATNFPAAMEVDYVRVYQCDSDPAQGVGCETHVNHQAPTSTANQVSTKHYTLFSDAENTILWQVDGQTVSRPLTPAVGWDNGGVISYTMVDIGGDFGNVLDVITSNSGNLVIHATDGEPFDLYGMGTSTKWWELAAGELKFDLYIDSSATSDDSQIMIKMDSGLPELGMMSLAVSELAKDRWTSVSVPINDLLATPGGEALDISAVVNLFVIEFSGAAHVRLDNVELICGHSLEDGCGIRPPVVE